MICTSDEAEDFLHLPLADPILEDEPHVLVACPLYHHIRSTLTGDLLCSILRWDWEDLFYEQHVREVASYISRIFRYRADNIDRHGSLVSDGTTGVVTV